ncbi:MAG: hypothetical protein ACKVOR_03920 [Flavobacteriales bacterium]
MKKILIILFILTAGLHTSAQSDAPTFTEVAVGSSGCYFYSPTDSVEFILEYADDSSLVWTGSTNYGDYGYEIICVQFTESMEATEDELVNLLESYMDYLKTAFAITSSFGYGGGHTLESNPNAFGVIDYWEDAEGDNWTVKGWIDNHYLAIMIVWGEEAPPSSITDVYLDGFSFP